MEKGYELSRAENLSAQAMNGKRSRAEPSRAENLSAQAMARASSALTHHYYLGLGFEFGPQRIRNSCVRSPCFQACALLCSSVITLSRKKGCSAKLIEYETAN